MLLISEGLDNDFITNTLYSCRFFNSFSLAIQPYTCSTNWLNTDLNELCLWKNLFARTDVLLKMLM